MSNVPQASVGNSGEETANLSPPSGEKPPEADPIPVRVVNAAYALAKQGEKVSIKAACEKAVVNRSHFSRTYPEEARLIKRMSLRDPMRGSKENGDMEAWEED